MRATGKKNHPKNVSATIFKKEFVLENNSDGSSPVPYPEFQEADDKIKVTNLWEGETAD